MRTKWFEERLRTLAEFQRESFSRGGHKDVILKTLSQNQESLEEDSRGTRAFYPASTATDLLPSSNLLRGLIGKIGVATLASIPSERVAVFEDRPTRYGSPLPSHTDLSQAYVADWERLLAAGLHLSVQGDDRIRDSPVISGQLPDNPAAANRLRVSCYSSENSIWVSLGVYSRSGQMLDKAFLMASPSGTRYLPSAFLKDDLQRVDKEKTWVELSSRSADALGATSRPLEALPDWYSDPVSREPLDLFVREAVAGAMRTEKGACVAMDVPDAFWGLVEGCTIKGRVNLGAFRKALDEWCPFARIVDGDAIAWRLVDPEIAEARRADRSMLGRYAKDVEAGGLPDLRETSRFYHDSSREPSNLVAIWHQIARVATQARSSSLSPRIYAFLGAISESSGSSLASGRALSAQRLGVSSDLRRLFEHESGLPVVSGGTNPIPDIVRYPLELYTQEDVSPSPLSLAPVKDGVFRFWPAGHKEPGFWSPPEALSGMFRIPPPAFRLVGGQWTCRIGRETFEKGLDRLTYRRGSRQTPHLTILLPGEYRMPLDLSATVAPEPTTFFYHDLPESVRDANWKKAVAEGLAAAQKASRQNPSTP